MNAKTAIVAFAALMLIAESAYAFDLPFGLGEKAANGNGYGVTQADGDCTQGQGRFGRWGAGLTEEQRNTMQEKRAELIESGATAEEMREEMWKLKEELGIQGPYGKMAPWLTDEQRGAIQEKLAELKEQGATREEIRIEMHAFREELGIKGPGFVDEDGDGVCDHAGEGGYGRGREKGRR